MSLRTPLLFALLIVPSMASAQTPQNSTIIQAESGPVIVTWGQPATLFKANEYQVRISDFDSDGDGRLTRQEVPSDHALQYEFHVADSNNDGVLTANELVNW